MKIAFVGQAPTATPQNLPNPPSAAVLDWGIAGALLIYLGKEAISFFKQKDEKDDRLTDSLIQDLRGEAQAIVRQNNALLLELRSLAVIEAQDRKKLLEAIAETTSLTRTLQRDTGSIYLECRSSRDLLVILDSKIDAIHSRLDFQKAPKREEGAELPATSSIIRTENY